MGKHETGYARVERDLYPKPHWVVAALAEYVDLRGLTAWECTCGDGRMAEPLRRRAGCAHVHTSDIVDCGAEQNEVLDFLSAQMPKLARFDLIVTNPPFGQGGRVATAFIEVVCGGCRSVQCWRCCCHAILIPQKRARATSAIVRISSARSC
jgi:hypothetical protein